jgi:hypothetical protein
MSSTLSTQPDPKDEDLLIQQLNSQADADEQEAKKILEDLTAEEKALQAEIDKAQIEYDQAMKEMVAAENYVSPTEAEVRTDIIAHREDTSTLFGNYFVNERTKAAEAEANLAREIELKIATDAILEERAKLKKAEEYFALGLIPPSATDQQRMQFVDAIDIAEREKWAKLQYRKSRVDLMKIHQALVRAHNAFQLANKDTILKARYGKKVITDRWEIREVGTQYLAFGSPTNGNPRMAKIMRTYYPIQDYEEKPYDRIYYKYNPGTGEWDQQNPLLGFRSTPAPNTNTAELPWLSDGPDLVFFTRDGVFPRLPWLRTRWEPYQSQSRSAFGYQGSYKDDRDNEFVAYFKDENQKIGRFNQKRGFSKCKPGYWFYESIPEESSQCVYMGHSMVDTNFSYYPASIGFSYQQNLNETDLEYFKEAYTTEYKAEYDKAVEAANKGVTAEEGIELIKESERPEVQYLVTKIEDPASQTALVGVISGFGLFN